MGWLSWLGVIVGGVLALIYLGAPLLVWIVFRKQRANLVLIEEVEVDEAVRGYLQSGFKQLRGLGFEEVGWLADRDTAASQVTHCVVLARPDERVLAMASVVVSPVEGGPNVTAAMVELSSEFDDGQELCTNNSDEVIFPASAKPHATVIQLPQADSVAELHDVHLKVVGWMQRTHDTTLRALEPADPYRAPTRAHVAEEVRGSVARDFDCYVKQGYMRTEDQVVYRLTLGGALIMTWRQLWPLKRWHRWRRAQRVSALLARVEREA